MLIWWRSWVASTFPVHLNQRVAAIVLEDIYNDRLLHERIASVRDGGGSVELLVLIRTWLSIAIIKYPGCNGKIIKWLRRNVVLTPVMTFVNTDLMRFHHGVDSIAVMDTRQ